MSYLLDALRKSEEERQKRAVRPAGAGFTFVRDSTPPKKKFAFGLILSSLMLLAAVILGAGWWWSQSQVSEPAAPADQVESIGAAADEALPAAEEAPPAPLQLEAAPPEADPSSLSGPGPDSPDVIGYLSEMSPEFQAALPELSFSGHVYSPDPRLRMIMINNAVVREGDPIAADLTLDEIVEEGVVLRFNNTRFRIKLF